MSAKDVDVAGVLHELLTTCFALSKSRLAALETCQSLLEALDQLVIRLDASEAQAMRPQIREWRRVASTEIAGCRRIEAKLARTRREMACHLPN